MTKSVEEMYYEADSFWSGEALKDPGNARRIEKTIDLIPAGTKSMLDVGCGNGIFGHRLLERRPEIDFFGVDRSETALSYVRFRSQVASIDALPFESESFDTVSCLQVIEHLPNETYIRSLRELARVARNHLLIGVPFEEKLDANTTQCPQCTAVFNVDFHMRSYDMTTATELLSDYGFKLISSDFPAAKRRTKYLNEILSAIKNRKSSAPGFLSPVCPVCGFVSGDTTPLSNPQIDPAQQTGSKSLPRKLLSGAVRAADLILPKEEVKGYWLIALYERG